MDRITLSFSDASALTSAIAWSSKHRPRLGQDAVLPSLPFTAWRVEGIAAQGPGGASQVELTYNGGPLPTQGQLVDKRV